MIDAESIIEARLIAYLDRRTPPRQIINNPAAQADEMSAILRTLMRFRPTGNLDEWWQRVEDGLSMSCETYSWPLPKHFAKAAEAASKTVGGDKTQSAGWEPDPLKVCADRMNGGDAVGDFWLYGEKAVALEDSGRVDAETFKRYRSAAYFNRVFKRRDGTEDRSKADAWEAKAREDHKAARNRSQRSGPAPDVDGIVKTFGAMRETPSRNDAPAPDRAGYMTPAEIEAEDRRAAG